MVRDSNLTGQLGQMLVCRPERRVGDEGGSEQDLLAAGKEFGEQLGGALAKVALFNQMETHSRIDGLTGMLRRQPFMDRLNEELKRASASDHERQNEKDVIDPVGQVNAVGVLPFAGIDADMGEAHSGEAQEGELRQGRV